PALALHLRRRDLSRRERGAPLQTRQGVARAGPAAPGGEPANGKSRLRRRSLCLLTAGEKGESDALTLLSGSRLADRACSAVSRSSLPGGARAGGSWACVFGALRSGCLSTPSRGDLPDTPAPPERASAVPRP